MFLRSMEENDVALVLQLQNTLAFQNWTGEHFLREIRNTNSFTMVLDNGTISGYVVLSCLGHEGELLTIALHPQQQGLGHGTAMLTHVMELAYRHGVRVVFLEVHEKNTPAQSLYTRLGFTPVGCRMAYYSDGASAQVWRRELG